MSKYGISLDLMKDSEVDIIKDFLKIKGYKRRALQKYREPQFKSN